jgi:hypothetical protein
MLRHPLHRLRKHKPVSRTTEAAGVADACTHTTAALTQEERQAEIYRAEEMRIRTIADAWNGVTKETAQDRPQVGDSMRCLPKTQKQCTIALQMQ